MGAPFGRLRGANCPLLAVGLLGMGANLLAVCVGGLRLAGWPVFLLAVCLYHIQFVICGLAGARSPMLAKYPKKTRWRFACLPLCWPLACWGGLFGGLFALCWPNRGRGGLLYPCAPVGRLWAFILRWRVFSQLFGRGLCQTYRCNPNNYRILILPHPTGFWPVGRVLRTRTRLPNFFL